MSKVSTALGVFNILKLVTATVFRIERGARLRALVRRPAADTRSRSIATILNRRRITTIRMEFIALRERSRSAGDFLRSFVLPCLPNFC